MERAKLANGKKTEPGKHQVRTSADEEDRA